MTENPTVKRQRGPGRPFQPGQSGNPAGARTGSRHRTALALDALSAGRATAIVESMVQRAIEGDVAAARIILDRAWPARRGRPTPLALPPLESLADVPRATAAIAAAVAAGELTSEEAAGLAGMLAAHVRAVEGADLEARIRALEAGQQRGGDRQ